MVTFYLTITCYLSVSYIFSQVSLYIVSRTSELAKCSFSLCAFLKSRGAENSRRFANLTLLFFNSILAILVNVQPLFIVY